MKHYDRLEAAPVIPVVVIEDAKDAVPTAKALLAGGIDVMEITLRTAAAVEAINAVHRSVPEMLVGAGTVLNIEQAEKAEEAGSSFVVSPGLDADLVEWCVERGITVVPGCVTPSEIMEAMKLGINVVKFFPANVYGGLNAMKALAAPFGNIKFIPTGGVNCQNIGDYSAAPYICTVGGSWVCSKADISSGDFDRITALCAEAVKSSLGFELAHIGVNTDEEEPAKKIAGVLEDAFNFKLKEGSSSIFAGAGIEVMKSSYLGEKGHIAIKTNNIKRAMCFLEKKGFSFKQETAKYKGDRLIAVYLSDEFGGFAVHLLQR